MLRLRRALQVCGFVALTACGGSAPVAPEPLPSWLTALIHNLETAPVANPPASIAQYEYKGGIVYFLPQRCCDTWSDLYRADGSVMCHPDGGLTGKGDGLCPDFFARRTGERIIWRDPRGGH
jgi:hypothetical protein